MSGTRGRGAQRWYLLLLRLLPRAVRREVGDEMLAVFRDELAERRRSGRRAPLFGFWLLMILDVLTVAWQERIRGPSAAAPPAPGRGRGHARRETMDHWLLDLRTGLRTLRRSPGYTLTAIVILGLAIGANATIFSLVHTLFLASPPHVAEPERLVRVHRTSSFNDSGALAYPDYAYYRDHTTTLDGLAVYGPGGVPLAVSVGSDREALLGWLVSANYFDVLGVRPAIGRWFHPDEDVVGAPAQVAVISHRTWQRLFDGAASAVGSSLALNGHPFTLVGVAPAGFRGVSPIESQPDLWVPVTNQPVLAPLGGDFALERVPDNVHVWLWSVGRLAPGITVVQASADLALLGEQLERDYAEWNEGTGARVTAGVGVHPRTGGGMLTIARILAAVVAVVLLVACANIAILLLARAAVRRRETGVRLAIGASRSRIVRLMLTESLLVSFAGGFVGLLLAYSTARLAASLLPVTLSVEVQPSAAVMVFAFACAALAAILFTLLPAAHASGGRVATLLHQGAAGRGTALQTGLVALQVALSVMLVVSGMLLVRSLRNARAVDLGFGVEGRTILSVNLRNHGYDAQRTFAYTTEAIERLSAVSGVETASASAMVPFAGSWTGSVVPEGRPLVEESLVDSGFNAVAPGYFEVMNIPIVAGRDLTARDDATAPPVALINQEFAARYFPDRDPVGQRLYRDPEETPTEVVGVARDARYYQLDEEPQPMIYLATLQRDTPRVSFLVRSEHGAGVLERALHEAVASVDSEVVLGRTTTLEELVGGQLGRYRTAATLVGLFALLALILACVGLYGALSYLVVQRTREIGIRVAVGAAPREVARGVLRRGLLVAAAGLAFGLLGASWATRWLESLLFGLERLDPATFAAVPLFLLAVAALASVLPARRAMRIDPIRAIRVD